MIDAFVRLPTNSKGSKALLPLPENVWLKLPEALAIVTRLK